MTKLLVTALLLCLLPVKAQALEIEAPPVPGSGFDMMPEDTENFGNALGQLLKKALYRLRPEWEAAVETALCVTAGVLLIRIVRTMGSSVFSAGDIVGAAVISAVLFSGTDGLIRLAADTIQELSHYGKLLFPVMTAAMAAQGGVTVSAALYGGTALFDAVLSGIVSSFLLPGVSVYLALALAGSCMEEDVLKKGKELLKNALSWCLKLILTVFTTYMSITGVVSGTTDAAALKAAKVTISSVVPIVGGIMSDASEAVLVSAGLMKNAAGIYGILALLSICVEPFLRIGVPYLVMKATAAVCGIFGTKPLTGLIEDFSTAMGMLLAMTGSVCLLLLISVVCFMKGVG